MVNVPGAPDKNMNSAVYFYNVPYMSVDQVYSSYCLNFVYPKFLSSHSANY